MLPGVTSRCESEGICALSLSKGTRLMCPELVEGHPADFDKQRPELVEGLSPHRPTGGSPRD